MARSITPIFADLTTAAHLFSMKPSEFAGLVDAGFLPRPCWIGGLERWHVADLEQIARGDAMEGDGDIQW